LVRALLAITKIGAVVFVAWLTIGGALGQIADGCGLGVTGQWSAAWSLMGLMAWRVLVVLLVLGGIDWAWQWRKVRQDLMMTRREVLDDLRKTEGDPLMRSRMRKKRQSKTGEQS
jgi:flagellar biosynthetic protein FlhB